jgi:hypothetical protein
MRFFVYYYSKVNLKPIFAKILYLKFIQKILTANYLAIGNYIVLNAFFAYHGAAAGRTDRKTAKRIEQTENSL